MRCKKYRESSVEWIGNDSKTMFKMCINCGARDSDIMERMHAVQMKPRDEGWADPQRGLPIRHIHSSRRR